MMAHALRVGVQTKLILEVKFNSMFGRCLNQPVAFLFVFVVFDSIKPRRHDSLRSVGSNDFPTAVCIDRGRHLLTVFAAESIRAPAPVAVVRILVAFALTRLGQLRLARIYIRTHTLLI
ncbi:hypothetical protein NP493_122g03025 [Ridgeia piscesae]|uniref:Uncharacterized protein n=1 Tax=Ridgeia piscesae TaxID=27915 RepID=A0AAD9P659_RIDPI|nr:hypothetical protein NP493_122g03025 [Ridgeia piscesae]